MHRLRAKAASRQHHTQLTRWLYTTTPTCFVLKQLPNKNASQAPAAKTVPAPKPKAEEKQSPIENKEPSPTIHKHAKRNQVGVQLLSRTLHSQLFPNVSFPPPSSTAINIAKSHLAKHGLDPAQGSVLPDTSFTLPPLQGRNLAEHFHTIGKQAAEPWLSLSQQLSTSTLPPKPEQWEIRGGWTKYTYLPGGGSYWEHVACPEDEQMLVFDVETMPHVHPYAVLACAASPSAWYAWISPWLLGESIQERQLVPLGDAQKARVVVGHNVAYDRARVKEEYSLTGTQTRFVDTMSLHVAVKGISSHQRPAWMKYRKAQAVAKEQRAEAEAAVADMLEGVSSDSENEVDAEKRDVLLRLKKDMEESLRADEDDEGGKEEKRWEDLTSANSLRDVAKLHCGIDVPKEVRNDFMLLSRSEILANVSEYLVYCATDVSVTHAVYKRVLPAFLKRCPHPVSFAGVLVMGSSVLPVNQEWERYIERAERVYREMEDGVKDVLRGLAEGAKGLMEGEGWRGDVWLSQLDWTAKVVGKSRGVGLDEEPTSTSEPESDSTYTNTTGDPAWYTTLLSDPFSPKSIERVLPLILRLSYDGHALLYTPKEKWHYLDNNNSIARLPTSTQGKKTSAVLSKRHAGVLLAERRMGVREGYEGLAEELCRGDRGEDVSREVVELAREVVEEMRTGTKDVEDDPWLRQLDWSLPREKKSKVKKIEKEKVYWPKWYWDATKPRKGVPAGTLDVTARSRLAPLLLKLTWRGWPLAYSREHGWCYRVSPASSTGAESGVAVGEEGEPLTFYDKEDELLAEASLRDGCRFYRMPHKDGPEVNVGTPLGKGYMKAASEGVLKSAIQGDGEGGEGAGKVVEMNARCSYWISSRERIKGQMVVWDDEGGMGFPEEKEEEEEKWGLILPQVITMGTVTRRAIEKTWLTASNAKPSRVGSELKAMVRAPRGHAIVGADVDSEELWIASCMGDAQFGVHGATALGWMTLEGTKGAGTDLHSKTAGILGISRDEAKVFNYSRIYGAGVRHAVLLLMQSGERMTRERARELAESLYKSTKGRNTHRGDMWRHGRKFWFGGTESYVFNKLEEIALSEEPRTPALGCGITDALSGANLPGGFGNDYMTSRINWVVQSSGVDYLHMLIVCMEHLIREYGIKARYMISVHDELRYLVKEEDRYRAAMALQIANLWTRAMFAHMLGMDDLPAGVAFFSGVDVDRVLRKEPGMSCVTPSLTVPIAPGESLDVGEVLRRTGGGSLFDDGRDMPLSVHGVVEGEGEKEGYKEPDVMKHRAESVHWLQAQATADFAEIKHLAFMASGRRVTGDVGGGKRWTKKS